MASIITSPQLVLRYPELTIPVPDGDGMKTGIQFIRRFVFRTLKKVESYEGHCHPPK
jgi:hypothetical protein